MRSLRKMIAWLLVVVCNILFSFELYLCCIINNYTSAKKRILIVEPAGNGKALGYDVNVSLEIFDEEQTRRVVD